MKANNRAQAGDRALIERVLNDDARAFQEFEARYRQLIYGILHRHRVHPQDRDDIYQELYVRLCKQNRRRLRLWMTKNTSEFGFYLTVMVRNLVVDWYRRHAAVILGFESLDLAATTVWTGGRCESGPSRARNDGLDDLLSAERANAVRAGIGYLCARDADLIRRYYFCEQNYQEIAQALSMSVGNVGVALSRARLRLGQHLSCQQPDLFGTNLPQRIRASKAA